MPVTRGIAWGLQGRALEALAGDACVGHDRVTLLRDPSPSGERGEFGVRAQVLRVESMRTLDEDDGVRARDWRGVAVDAWESVITFLSSRGSASLNYVAVVGSSLLRHCHGSMALFTTVAGSKLFAPHTTIAITRQWLGTVKNCLAYSQMLRVLASLSLVYVASAGDFTAELAYGNHPSVAPHAVVIDDNIWADILCGRTCSGV